jgi:alkylhydroperoxidase family enzyme
MKTTQNRNRLRIAITVSFTMILGELASDLAISQDNTTPTNNASLVMKNPPNQPRYTPATRDAMKQYLEDLKQRTPRIPLPQQSEDEKKLELEDPRTYGYEGRLRRIYLMDTTTGSYSGFSGSSGARSSATSLPPDPALTLDYAFKVRLFWIAARANNCQYCLGHQESKLLAAGMSEDAIAALDSDWGAFDVKEQVAFALAKRLTNEPHLLTSADIDACKEHFSDLQILEMIGSIAGNNASNRRTEETLADQSLPIRLAAKNTPI